MRITKKTKFNLWRQRMFDYQKVKLIGITKPVSDDFVMNSSAENLISYCARVSNPSNQTNYDSAPKLLKYCMNNDHWSIFEMVNIVMSIETTRDIGRQILRHRSFSFQEFSTRYAEVDGNLDFIREARLQDTKNRQNSIELNDTVEHASIASNFFISQHIVWDKAIKFYKQALSEGIAKEQARSLLPEGLTMSRMYMNGTLRSWIHYCNLRMENGTQKEHIDIATKCYNILVEEFPFMKEI